MNLLRPATFDEMIAVYLQVEWTGRFGPDIKAILEQQHLSASILQTPQLDDPAENKLRRSVLATYRAYVFDELPAHVAWYWAEVSREEVSGIRYINYSYWNELSKQTRLATVAAESIRDGVQVFDVSNDGFWAMAAFLRAGGVFGPLILVAESPDAPLSVYEGHARLTAYMLAPEQIPPSLNVLVGFAPECAGI